jgi:hypothetical protein
MDEVRRTPDSAGRRHDPEPERPEATPVSDRRDEIIRQLEEAWLRALVEFRRREHAA